MKKISTSAPGKLMLFGEHAVVYNHPCLVTAVDERMYVTIELINDSSFFLDAPDVNITNYKKPISEIGKGEIPKGAQFIEIAVKNFFEEFNVLSGMNVKTTSDFSSEFGFGSSSAVTVSTLKALSELFGKNLSNENLFNISYKTVLDIQKKGSGFDVAAAVYGGTLYFLTGGKKIETIALSSLPLIVGYSGIKADTVSLINKVKDLSDKNPQKVDKIYNSIHQIVEQAKIALMRTDLKEVGKLMTANQELLRDLGVSVSKLDNMILASNTAGSYGAKLSGAGGGDCMIALSSSEKTTAVETAIKNSGGIVLNVKTNAKGAKIEYEKNSSSTI